jgi:branched-chain amino acid transport system permease protein
LYFVLPGYRVLGSQVLIAALFCLSLDLILGYAGIVSLGHAAFFGLGAYTAGLLAAHGWGEPLSGLAAARHVSQRRRGSRRASSWSAGATSRASW